MFEGTRFDGELTFRKIQIHVYRTLEVYFDQALWQHQAGAEVPIAGVKEGPRLTPVT